MKQASQYFGRMSARWLSPSALYRRTWSVLMAARVLTGLAHGVFFSIGSTIATSLVAKDKAARAIALMFTGLTVALVTGVPLGTWIGQRFGWQSTFLAVALLGALAASRAEAAETLRIGYQKSSTLIALLKTNGELEKALAPLDIKVSWHEFSRDRKSVV